MKLYGYCVVANDDTASIQVDGVENARVEILLAGDLRAYVSSFNGDRVAVTRPSVLRHERVVRAVLEKSTPLPFRFGTLATSDQLRSYLQSRSQSLKRKLAEVKGCVEMNIKIIWNPPDHQTTDDRQTPGDHHESGADEGRGAKFLLAKKNKFVAERLANEGAEQINRWIESLVNPFVRKRSVSLKPEQKMVFSGAYLLEREALEAFREQVSEARGDRPDLRFLLSGPWAPYSFSNIDLEFQSQLGVS